MTGPTRSRPTAPTRSRPTAPTTADVVVVGLGIHGSAAALELSARGLQVVGVDRFAEGHTRGSSHGTTRMIRRAYPNPLWDPLVERAFAGWRRWEASSGRALVHRTGGLYAHRSAGALRGPGCTSLDDPAQQTAVMPSLAVPDGHHVVHDPGAGVVLAPAALDVARSGARALGARLSFDERVLGWEQTRQVCEVRTDRRLLRTRHLVLAAGGWVGALVPELARLFDVWRIVTATLRPGQAVATAPALGAFSVDRPEGLLFGIPDTGGTGFKAGLDAGAVWDPDRAPDPPTPQEVAQLTDLMVEHVPGVEPDVVEATACLYTMTADRRFVVGALPWAPSVVVAAACSGHGFKFGPAIGEAVADLCQGLPRDDLDFVGVRRHLP